MALEKQTKDDYEIRGEYKHINVRTKTSIIENGNEISYSYHRKVLSPDMDLNNESNEIISSDPEIKPLDRNKGTK